MIIFQWLGDEDRSKARNGCSLLVEKSGANHDFILRLYAAIITIDCEPLGTSNRFFREDHGLIISNAIVSGCSV